MINEKLTSLVCNWKVSALCLIFIVCLFSCTDEMIEQPEEEQETFQINASLEVVIEHCRTIRCDELITESSFTVHLYESREDALSERDVLYSASTNGADNTVLFSGIHKSLLYIRLETEGSGIYIASQRFTSSTTKAFHTITFTDGYSFDENDDLALTHSDFNFSNPAFGQESRYSIYELDSIDLMLPDTYLAEKLHVRVVDQLDRNRFLVRESFDELPSLMYSYIDGFYDSAQVNVWTFESGSIKIENYSHEFVLSPMFGLDKLFQEGQTVTINTSSCPANTLDLDKSFYDIEWQSCMNIPEYEFGDESYSDVLVRWDSYAAVDFDDRIAIYSGDGAVLRYIGINRMGRTTYGFVREAN